MLIRSSDRLVLRRRLLAGAGAALLTAGMSPQERRLLLSAGARRPTLWLDLTQPNYDGRLAYARASGQTYFGPNSLMGTAANDVWPRTYDLSTHAALGREVWWSATNQFLWSTDFTASSWQLLNGATKGPSVVGLDGTASGITVNFAAQANSQIYQTVATSAGATASVWARSDAGTQFAIKPSSEVAGPPFTPTSTWQRFPYTTTGNNANFGFTNVGGAAGSVDLWGPQVEAGPIATAYIPTSSTPVTRATPTATIPVGPWFNPLEGTLVAKVILPSRSANQNAASLMLDDGNNTTRANVIELFANVNNGSNVQGVCNIRVGNSQTGNVSTANVAANGNAVTLGLAYTQTTVRGMINGSVTASSAVTGLPTVSRLVVATEYWGGVVPLNGTLQIAGYYPWAMSTAELAQVRL